MNELLPVENEIVVVKAPAAIARLGVHDIKPIAGGAVSAKWYGQALLQALSKKIDLTADDIRVALLANTYTPNQDTHVFFADVTPGTNEVTGAGYTAGGYVLAAKALAYNAGTNVISFGNGANPSWTGASLTARYAVYYDHSPATDATRPLISYVDFGADVPVVSGTLAIDVTAGIATVTPA